MTSKLGPFSGDVYRSVPQADPRLRSSSYKRLVDDDSVDQRVEKASGPAITASVASPAVTLAEFTGAITSLPPATTGSVAFVPRLPPPPGQRAPSLSVAKK